MTTAPVNPPITPARNVAFQPGDSKSADRKPLSRSALLTPKLPCISSLLETRFITTAIVRRSRNGPRGIA
jgi:hypothetical protein